MLTGAGDKAFCAGADLQPGKGFAFDFARPNLDYADLLRDAQNATLPSDRARQRRVHGRRHGPAVHDRHGGGRGDHVTFGLPEVKVGVFPMQVMSLLQQIAPRRVCANGRSPASRSTPPRRCRPASSTTSSRRADLDAKVEWLVARIVDKSPTAMRRGKYALRAIEAMSFDEAIAYTESQIGLLALTEDAKEGLASFNENRKPRWTGR